MGRRNYTYWTQSDFRGGINQEPENARPNQVLDAKNVWCPQGLLEQRPGYFSVNQETRSEGWAGGGGTGNPSGATTTQWVIKEDNSGSTPVYTDAGGSNITLTARTTGLGGDRLYHGFDLAAATDSSGDGFDLADSDVTHFSGVDFKFAADADANANASRAKLEYWDGVSWRVINNRITSAADFLEFYQLGGGQNVLNSDGTANARHYTEWFAVPQKMALRTVTSLTDSQIISADNVFWFRWTILDASTDTIKLEANDINLIRAINNDTVTVPDLQRRIRSVGIFQLQYNTLTRYAWITSPDQQAIATFKSLGAINAGSYETTSSTLNLVETQDFAVDGVEKQQPTVAIIPDFGEAFVAFGKRIVRYDQDIAIAPAQAQVETNPDLVGLIVTGSGTVKADFHPDFIVQDTEFPKADYILYHDGQIFAAGIKDEPFTIKWSGPTPFHKVWPTDSFVLLGEEDNSPITGLSVFNEQVVVFKQDSIWRLVSKDENDLQLNEYIAVKDVSGVGTVSNASIAQIPGGLIFLAEDGVYLYNGTPQIQKLSENIDPKVSTILPQRWKNSAGVHWREKNCYLLAVSTHVLPPPTTFSHDVRPIFNNDILVYDYKHKTVDEKGMQIGAWWFWEGVEAECMTVVEDSTDNQRIYLGDSAGGLFEFGRDIDDHSRPVSAFVKTQRIGYGDFLTKTLRTVNINGDSASAGYNITVLEEDKDTDTADALVLTDPAETLLIGTWTFVSSILRAKKRREKRLDYRKTGDWFTIKVDNKDQRNQPLKLYRLSAGLVPLGHR